jgi:long-chain acyl-CoA synthetase
MQIQKGNLVEMFERAANAQRQSAAIYCGDEVISYAQRSDRSTRAASGLATQLQLKPTDRVAILLKNCPEYIVALFAALKTGATVVPVNNFLKADEIAFILNDCGVSCLITSAEFSETLAQMRQRVPTLQHVVSLDSPNPVATTTLEQLSKEIAVGFPQLTPDDLAVIIYTSGTTGKPKGATLTHDNLASNVVSCVDILEEEPCDCMTLLLPMFHSYMLTVCILTPLSVGSSILIIKSLHPPKHIFDEIKRRRASILVGIPQLYQNMAQANIPAWKAALLRLPFIGRKLFPLRLAVSGAAPLPLETLDAFSRKYPFPLLEGYGLSEAAPVVTMNPIHGQQKGGTVGLPLKDVEVKIFDESGKELPVGEVGEIVVRGPNVMRGYWNQPEATRDALRNGWLHTGDLGKKDADGYITIVDRKKDMLLVRGMNVYPREIEEVIYQFAGVKEAAVVRKADAHRGECPVAFVVPAEGATIDPKALQRFLKEKLADYKLPRQIKVMEKLPRTASGKVAKLELRKLAEEERALATADVSQ